MEVFPLTQLPTKNYSLKNLRESKAMEKTPEI